VKSATKAFAFRSLAVAALLCSSAASAAPSTAATHRVSVEVYGQAGCEACKRAETEVLPVLRAKFGEHVLIVQRDVADPADLHGSSPAPGRRSPTTTRGSAWWWPGATCWPTVRSSPGTGAGSREARAGGAGRCRGRPAGGRGPHP